MPKIDRKAARISLLVCGILFLPITISIWIYFPAQPIAWITLAGLFFWVVVIYDAERPNSQIMKLMKLSEKGDAWFLTRRGKQVDFLIGIVALLICGIYAIVNLSWRMGLVTVVGIIFMVSLGMSYYNNTNNIE